MVTRPWVRLRQTGPLLGPGPCPALGLCLYLKLGLGSCEGLHRTQQFVLRVDSQGQLKLQWHISYVTKLAMTVIVAHCLLVVTTLS